MGEVVRLEDRRRAAPVEEALPPPHDLAAEAACLSAGMLDHGALLKLLEVLRPEHFYSEANGRIWQACQDLATTTTPVDLVTVGSWLDKKGWLAKCGGSLYLAQIADATPAITHVLAHAREVVERWEDRELIATCLRVAAEGRTPGATVATKRAHGVEREPRATDRETWRAQVRAELGRVTAPRQELAGRTISEVGAAVRVNVAEGLTQRSGVRYGLRRLEERFGLLARRRQHVLAGRSEHGKTALACQIAWYVAGLWPDPCATCRGGRVQLVGTCPDCQGSGCAPRPEVREAVYIMSGEMPGETLLFRSACSLAGIDAMAVESGHATAEDMQGLSSWLEQLRALPIVIDDKPAPPAEIAKRVRAWQEALAAGRARREDRSLLPRCRLQLVIGDHLQELATLAPPLGPRADHLQQIGATAIGWRDEIAKGCKTATLLLSQLTRASADPKAKKRWPVASDLWGGTPIESSADTIIAVHRPELFGGKVPEAWRSVAGVVPLKGRMGGSRRVVRLGFDKGVFSDDLPPWAEHAQVDVDDLGDEEGQAR